jgi:hypothetical protein
VISARVGPGGSVLLIAPVRGLSDEARRTVESLRDYAPGVVGLGLSAEEMRGLVDYFVLAEAEPIVPLTGVESSEVRGLVRFGEVRVPNPAFVNVLRWGHDHGIPVEPLDPSDERSANLFTEHIGYVELVRRTVRERRVARSPPAPSTADEFALAWEGQVAGGSGSRAFARARDRHLAREVTRLCGNSVRVGVVVDRERFPTVRALLDGTLPSEMADE